MLLRLADIRKEYAAAGHKKRILDGLDLELDRGQLVSVTGKSGCGKTTLLNIIAGITYPDRGKVFINDKKIGFLFDCSLSRRRNREIGLIFQTFRLLDNESVLSNVFLPARIKGSIGKETKEYVYEILGKLRIYKYRKSRVGILSGGQKQRVAIARALVNRPSIILADEPTANLDKKTSVEIFDILEELKDEGKALLIVTHKEYMHKRSLRVFNLENGKLAVL